MCSVNDNDFEDSNQCMESKPTTVEVGTLCKKCETEKASVVLRIRDAYCRNCFLSSATHKFRASLGKSRLLKTQDNVLLAVSPSQSSLALLHLVKMGVDDTSQKRLRCTPYAVYIDEGAVLNQSVDERQQLCCDVRKLIQSVGIPAFVSSLHRSLICDVKYASTELIINEERDRELQNLLDEVGSLTSRDDLIQKLRCRLLFMIAEELKCKKIFVAETGTHLAVKLMTNLSLGRGAQLPYDIGFCDSRHLNVKLLRPLRDLSNKEIVFYNAFNSLSAIHSPSLGTKSDPYSSIQKLTEKFIVDLQDEFPSTVSTVFRTGEKLSSNSHPLSPEETCALCQAPLDTLQGVSSALQDTEFSRMVSRLGPSGFDNLSLNPCTEKLSDVRPCGSDSACNCSRRNYSQSLGRQQVEQCLCYGCRLIVRDMESLDHLPSTVLSSIRGNIRLKEMRNEIKDFLL